MALLTLSKPRRAYAALLSVILSAAISPIAIRYAQLEAVPSLVIILVRLFLISLLLMPFVLRMHSQELRQLERQDWGWALGAGLMHVLGLALLFFSLEYTSILVSAVLRRTSPLWVIGLEILLLHAVFTRQVWMGAFLTVAGTIVVVLGGANAVEGGSNPLLGGLLALLTAVANTFYLLIGRKLRHKLPFLAYSWLVFTSGGLIGLLMVLFTETPLFGYSSLGYFWVLMATILGQFFGHLPINAALHYFPATYLSILMQLSVILSALLAFLFLGQIPSILQSIGSVLALFGIMLVIRNS